MLSSFIEAHKDAQEKIHEFVGTSYSSGNVIELVLNESRASVVRAEHKLKDVNVHQMKGIFRKQTIRAAIAKQTSFVGEMTDEGLLNNKDAQKIYSEINDDIRRIESARKKMLLEEFDKAGSRMTIVSGKLPSSQV